MSLERAGLPAVRRPTGGRALLHAREVTYSVVLPLHEQWPWRVAYDAINALLLRALVRLGVPARIVAERDAEAVRPDGPLCFDAPAAGEIVVAGRKLVGSAVWRQGPCYLQHGSILLADDQSLLSTASAHPMPLPPPAASLDACAPAQAQWSVVRDALAATLAECLADRPHGELAPFTPHSGFEERVAVHRTIVSDSKWLWRR